MTQQDALNWIQGGWRSSPWVRFIPDVGVGIDTDKQFGFQCKDFANGYGFFLGHPIAAGNAWTVWAWAQDPWYSKVANPLHGDFAVFKPAPSNGGAGHVDLVIRVGNGTFDSVAQNWFDSNVSVGSPPAVVTHRLDASMYGFLRPSFGQPGGPMLIPDQDNWFNRYDKLMFQIRGRNMDRQEFRANFVGQDQFRMVEVLSDSPEAEAASHAQVVGKYALEGDWQARLEKCESGPPTGDKPYDGPPLFVKK